MENGDKILRKLDVIDEKVDTLLLWRAEHTKAHELIERDVAEHREVLFENPYLVSKVNTLWNCKSETTKWREFWMSILKYLVVAGIVALVTWLFVLYKNISV